MLKYFFDFKLKNHIGTAFAGGGLMGMAYDINSFSWGFWLGFVAFFGGCVKLLIDVAKAKSDAEYEKKLHDLNILKKQIEIDNLKNESSDNAKNK